MSLQHVALVVRLLHEGLPARLAVPRFLTVAEVGALVHLKVELASEYLVADVTRVAFHFAMDFLQKQHTHSIRNQHYFVDCDIIFVDFKKCDKLIKCRELQ